MYINLCCEYIHITHEYAYIYINDVLFFIRTNHEVLLTVGAFLIQLGTYHAVLFSALVVSYIIIYRIRR